jgi:GrpB-like predicted nucleotidyltransferase (UPF0157 family)
MIDEEITVVEYDPRWVEWYAADAREIMATLGVRVRELQHFGSTSVHGLAAKPVIDILVAPQEWPLVAEDRDGLQLLGYEHLGEAGVPGREYFRRRAEHHTNLAVVEWGGVLWSQNLLVRDYLREDGLAAARYGEAKLAAWRNGSRTLMAYSACKANDVEALIEAARKWRAGRADR